MAKQVTQYNILLSCPSDIKEELEVVNETIVNFNRLFGEANKIDLKVKHWSTDVYPESGGRPQELINDQIVKESDAAIAVFWTRFGTPTEKYGSGTEEEIEELIQMGKQVFVYFSNRSMSPSDFNHKELERVEEFKRKYQDKGIYCVYNNIDEFKKLLTNHVSMYFMNIVSEDVDLQENKIDGIELKSVHHDEIVDSIIMKHSSFRESQYCESSKDDIKYLFNEIREIELPERFKIVESNMAKTDENSNGFSNLAKKIGQVSLNNSLFSHEDVEITDKVMEVVTNFYLNEYSKELGLVFFNIGNLTKVHNMIGGGPMGMSPSYELSGTDEEKNKYKLILKLFTKIEEYKQAIEYFEYLDSFYWYSGAITNVGSSFDEDVDISLFVKKGCVANPENLIVPGDEFVQLVNAAFEKLFMPVKTSKIENYMDYPIRTNIPATSLPLGLYGKTVDEEIEDNRSEYKEKVEDLFVYEIFNEDDYDVIRFNVSYIKHSTSVHFPSYLLFNTIPEKIGYEIVSKHSSRKFEGELSLLSETSTSQD